MKTEKQQTKKTRLHKRSFVFGFILVLFPWTLIAIPGTDNGGGGTTGLSVTRRVYGWPLVHMESTHAESWGTWRDGKFFRDERISDKRLKKIARSWLEMSDLYSEMDGKRDPILKWNLRFESAEEEYDFVSWDLQSFWADPALWPIWNKRSCYAVRYSGMILNLTFILVAFLFVSFLLEFKIRQSGRIFKFSTKPLLCFLGITGFLLFWAGREATEFDRKKVQIEEIIRIIDSGSNGIYTLESKDRFPLIVSQLLNNGVHPFGCIQSLSSFRIAVELDLDNETDFTNFRRLIDLTGRVECQTNLTVSNYRPKIQDLLNSVDCSFVTQLEADFCCFMWTEEQANCTDDFYDLEESQAIKQTGFKIHLDTSFPALQDLNLTVEAAFDLESQLKPFLDSPLKKLRISGLVRKHVEFLMKVKSKLPVDTDFEFLDELPSDMESEIRKGYLPINPDGLSSETR